MGIFGRRQKITPTRRERSDPLILEMGTTTESIIRNMLADTTTSFERTRRWVAEQEEKRVRERAEQMESDKRWAEHRRAWEENFLAEQSATSARRRREAEGRR